MLARLKIRFKRVLSALALISKLFDIKRQALNLLTNQKAVFLQRMFKGTISPLFGRVKSILNCINYTVSLLGQRRDILTELRTFLAILKREIDPFC